MVRLGRPTDLPILRDIERAAGETFRAAGMAAAVDDEPPDLAELARYQQGGRTWVAVDHEDQPVANLLIDEVDGTAHVEQVLVHPNHAHQRLGRALIDLAEQWGRKRGRRP